MSKKLHLHLETDASSKALHNALLERGHEVTHTPTEWMPFYASDEQQLLGAAAQVAPLLLIICGTSLFWESVILIMQALSLPGKEA